MQKILVYAATGEQAFPVLPQLRFGNKDVFALTRNKAKASVKENERLHVVEASLNDAQGLIKVTEGMDIVMLNIPFFSDDNTGAYAIEAAKQAGVKLIVWNANGEVPQKTSNRIKMNFRMENMEMLVASGIPYVVFQPTIYIENLLMQETARIIQEENRIEMVSSAEAVIPWMSTQDISACMVKAIGKTEIYNKVFTVKGSGWSGNHLAETFTKVLGREITYKQIDLNTYVKRVNLTMGESHGEEIMGLSPNKDQRPPREANFPKFAALDALEEFDVQSLPLENWVARHQHRFNQES